MDAVVLHPRRRGRPRPHRARLQPVERRPGARRRAERRAGPVARARGRPTSAGPTCGRRATPWTCSAPRGCSRAACARPVVREGRRLCLVDAVIEQDGEPVARASGLFLQPSEPRAGRGVGARRRLRRRRRSTSRRSPTSRGCRCSAASSSAGRPRSREHQNGERKMTWQTGMPVIPGRAALAVRRRREHRGRGQHGDQLGQQRRRADQHRHHPHPGPAAGQPRDRPGRRRPGEQRRHRGRHRRRLRPPGPRSAASWSPRSPTPSAPSTSASTTSATTRGPPAPEVRTTSYELVARAANSYDVPRNVIRSGRHGQTSSYDAPSPRLLMAGLGPVASKVRDNHPRLVCRQGPPDFESGQAT